MKSLSRPVVKIGLILRMILTLLLGTTVLAVESPANAAFPGTNGKIAFTSDRDGAPAHAQSSSQGEGAFGQPPVASFAQAAPGDLDPTFGTEGKVKTDFFGDEDRADRVVIQEDGKIVAGGQAYTESSGHDFALARYNPDGTLDQTFGSGGKVTTDFSGNVDAAFGMVLQADGKIVAAGQSVQGPLFSDFALARYNSDGTLDQTFGSGGKVTTDFAGLDDWAWAVALQSDGKIVAAGMADVPGTFDDFALARYNSDGTLDQTFGSGGKVTTDFSGDYDDARSVALQADDKIVAAGSANAAQRASFFLGTGSIGDVALARYNPDGALDPSFGSGGKVTTDFAGNYDRAQGVAIQGDGKIVAAGSAKLGSNTSSSDFALARYNPDGTLDPTFGIDGKVTTDFAGDLDEAVGVALQVDGKIVAGGQAYTESSGGDFALARYNADGALDPSFGSGGKVITDLHSLRDPVCFPACTLDVIIAVAVQVDGKIVAAGCTRCLSGDGDFALARYQSGGADLAITKTGNRTTPAPTGRNLTYTVTVTNNGPDSAEGVVVTDTLPGSVTFVSATASVGSCSGTAPVTCDLGPLSNGATATIQIVVKPTQVGSITNTASVTATTTDPNLNNNTAIETTTVCRITSRPTSIRCSP